jgi:Bacteriophage KPP10, Structural protein ORF10
MATPITYSFLDVSATFNGPNGAFPIGSTAGVAEEGITIEFAEDQDTVVIGADGSGMHSLHAGQSGSVTIRLLMTSPTNALLDAVYGLDRATPSSFGQNTIVVSWLTAGDVTVCTQCGFRKFPSLTYAKDGQMREWAFTAIKITPLLGAGS